MERRGRGGRLPGPDRGLHQKVPEPGRVRFDVEASGRPRRDQDQPPRHDRVRPPEGGEAGQPHREERRAELSLQVVLQDGQEEQLVLRNNVELEEEEEGGGGGGGGGGGIEGGGEEKEEEPSCWESEQPATDQ